MKKKRVLIDVNSAVPFYVAGRASGIGRTTMELVRALAELPEQPFDICLYSQNMKGIGARNMDASFEKKHFYLPVEDCPFSEVNNTLFPN